MIPVGCSAVPADRLDDSVNQRVLGFVEWEESKWMIAIQTWLHWLEAVSGV